MAGEQLEPVLMENVRLIFRNFQGRKRTGYDKEGARNFGVVLPDNVAEAMLADGWNVKYLDPREDDEEQVRTPFLPVKVNFETGRPPQIYQVTSRGRELIQEDTVGLLDGVDITNVDLIVRPYHYDINGRQGIAAYVKTMYVTIDEDPLQAALAEKYSSPSASTE